MKTALISKLTPVAPSLSLERGPQGRGELSGPHSAGERQNPPSRRNGSSSEKPTELLRLFIAVWLPDPLKQVAVARLEELRKTGRGIRWVRPEQLHFTLKFLGETPRCELPRLAAALEEVARSMRPFPVSLAPGGVFPPSGPPRVIWLGVAPVEELTVLASRVEEALLPLGYPSERKPFRPHLTLGRAEPGASFDRELLGRPFETGPVVIERLSLVQSILRPQGPVYTTLNEWPLIGDR